MLRRRKESIFPALRGIACSLIAGIVLAGCIGDDNTPTVNTPVAFMTIYHGAPNLAALDIYASDQKINGASFDYTTYSQYGSFYAGDCKLTFKTAGQSTALVDTTFALTTNNYYSLFLIKDASKTKALLIKDVTDPTTGTNAKIRFANLSPDATSDFNVTTDASTDPIFSNTGFKEVTAFRDIPQGVYSFNVLNSDTKDKVTSFEKVKIVAGTYYTIIVRGYITPPQGNTNKIGIDLETNQ